MTGLRDPVLWTRFLVAAAISVTVFAVGVLTWKAENDKDCYTVQMLMQSATPNAEGGKEFSIPVETRVNLCLTPSPPSQRLIGEQQE